MLKSHECPIELLEESREWNDYSYCLVHLLDEYPEYASFFKREIELGRKVIFDNSVFEGKPTSDGEYAVKIKEYMPSEYIVTDTLEDADATTTNFEKWIKSDLTYLPGKKIGVVQGKTLAELVDCYVFMATYADKIAISFDYSFYEQYAPHENKLVSWMKGRQFFIDYLISKGLWSDKPHHLLGCSLPQEFVHYKGEQYRNIETVDTSNPVVHAIKGIKYDVVGMRGVLMHKESVKMMDLMATKRDDIDDTILNQNLGLFHLNCTREVL